jgi:hypothetical protein
MLVRLHHSISFLSIVYLHTGNKGTQEIVIWAKTADDAKLIFAEKLPHCRIIKCELTEDE